MHKICFTISLFHASTCFEHHVLIVRGSKLYYTASGIITPIGGCPLHRLRESSLSAERTQCTHKFIPNQVHNWCCCSYMFRLQTADIFREPQFLGDMYSILYRLTNVNGKFNVCVTVQHWYNNINSQLDATIVILLTISIISFFGR